MQWWFRTLPVLTARERGGTATALTANRRTFWTYENRTRPTKFLDEGNCRGIVPSDAHVAGSFSSLALLVGRAEPPFGASGDSSVETRSAQGTPRLLHLCPVPGCAVGSSVPDRPHSFHSGGGLLACLLGQCAVRVHNRVLSDFRHLCGRVWLIRGHSSSGEASDPLGRRSTADYCHSHCRSRSHRQPGLGCISHSHSAGGYVHRCLGPHRSAVRIGGVLPAGMEASGFRHSVGYGCIGLRSSGNLGGRGQRRIA